MRLNYDRIVERSGGSRGRVVSGRPERRRRSSPAPRAGSDSSSRRRWPSEAGGWSSTPAARMRSRPPRLSCARSGNVIAVPGDVADERHRRELVAAAGEPIDLLVNNASVLGPSPQPALADYPLAELERVYRRERPRPAGARAARPSAPRRRRRDPQRHLRRRRRGIRGLGRLRVVEGRARPADSGPRGRAPRSAHLRRRSRRHADRRCTRRRSRARTSPTGHRPSESVPGLLRLIEGALPSGRYRAADLVPAPSAR